VFTSNPNGVICAHASEVLALQEIRMIHGSPFDRGAADSYYSRAMIPHKMVDGKQVLLERGKEWDEYMEGYACNENIGNFKDWGQDSPSVWGNYEAF
jgi:hypothetical protein